jgi:hypothetical protein
MSEETGFAEGLLAGGNGGFGGANGWEGIFGIIALLALANGGLFGGNGGNSAYSNELQTSILENSANQRQTCMDFANTNSNIVNGNYQTQNAVNSGFAQTSRDICTLGTSLTATMNNNQNDLQRQLFEMQRDTDNKFCQTNMTIVQESQSIKDMLKDNEIQNLRDKVSNLELQSAMFGVVRYPNGLTYNAGNSPFCASRCCG